MDSRLRGNDDWVQVSVIPAKAGIQWLNVSEILQLIEIKRIFWGLSSCLALGIMACPGASCVENFSVAVGFPKWCPWNAGPACQVWAREWWNIGMLVLKEVSHLLISLSRGVLPTNNCPVFPPSPCDLVLLHPLFHYSSIPIVSEAN